MYIYAHCIYIYICMHVYIYIYMLAYIDIHTYDDRHILQTVYELPAPGGLFIFTSGQGEGAPKLSRKR